MLGPAKDGAPLRQSAGPSPVYLNVNAEISGRELHFLVDIGCWGSTERKTGLR
jgi:hypothetical protein